LFSRYDKPQLIAHLGIALPGTVGTDNDAAPSDGEGVVRLAYALCALITTRYRFSVLENLEISEAAFNIDLSCVSTFNNIKEIT